MIIIGGTDERKGREERILAIGSVATSGHIWSTFSSSFYTYYIPFRILGSQESNASNSVQIRVETKKLWSLQENCAKLKGKFLTPQSKVLKFSHRAKHPPGTRVAFHTTQTNFCTVWDKVQKFRTPQFKVRNSFQRAKISVQGANSLNISFAHHYSRCENFCTMRNTSLAHEWHFT